MSMDALFNQALLAEASYADFWNENKNLVYTDPKDIKDALIKSGFTTIQAEDFVKHWEVIDHQPDTPSGFSATLFKNRQTGEYVFANRGTAGFFTDILSADVFGIVLGGKATLQITDMYRYFRKLETPEGQPVDYSLAEISMLVEFSGFSDPLVETSLISDLAADVGLGAISDTTSVTVTGHSLGGHLTTWFAGFFGSQVDHAYTYNGAGIGGFGVEIVDLLNQLIFGGEMFAMPYGEVTNIYAEQGLEVTAGVGAYVGDMLPIFIEDQGAIDGNLKIDNHSISHLTDALAIHQLINNLDASWASAAQIRPLLESASSDPKMSLESVVNILGDLFEVGASVAIDDRDGLYARLFAIKTEVFVDPDSSALEFKPQYQNLQIVDVNTLSSSSELDTAEGYAYRYALMNLNTFAITGADNLYEAHNLDGELDADNFSSQYLQDRADFLDLIIKRNSEDIPDSSYVPKSNGEFAIYEDLSSGDRLQTFAFADKVNKYAFGSESGDAIAGGADQDKLYGAGGDDTLHGGTGRDHLEGNADNDTLHGEAGVDYLYGGRGDDQLSGGADRDFLYGGEGADTYHYTLGDGDDFIDDLQGNNRLNINGHLITEITQVNAQTQMYEDSYGNSYLLTERGELVVTVADETQSGKITILNFDQETNDFGLFTAEPEVVLEETTNVIVDSGEIEGTAGSDLIFGSAEDDQVNSSAGNDTVEVGEGQDFVYGHSGNDSIIGGRGSDNLRGGEDDDTLFAGQLDDVIDPDEPNPSSSERDILAGEWGDDTLIGSAGQNLISGGLGTDTLIAGAGDDLIYGDSDVLSRDGVWSASYQDQMLIGIEGASLVGHEGSGSRDYIVAGSGNDTVFAEDGNDLVSGGTGDDVISGGDGDDTVDGGDGADRVFGEAGDDTLYGGVGNDFLSGDRAEDAGDDELHGGAGEDSLVGGGGTDWLYGGEGNDTLAGDAFETPDALQKDDHLYGEAGNDSLVGGGGADHLDGGDDDDQLFGDAEDTVGEFHGDDHLDGGAGNDQLVGYGGKDVLEGGAGDDQLFGDSSSLDLAYHGSDTLRGGSGNDSLSGQGGDDHLFGDAGEDKLFGGEGDDTLSGGSENDQLVGEAGADKLFGEQGDDLLFGGADNDLLEGGAGADELVGEEGDDLLQGGDGDDFLFGDSDQSTAHGDDTLEGGAGNDYLRGFGGNDRLYGGSGNDKLYGENGDDYISGGDGNDLIVAGRGDDVVNGGAGRDIFVYSPGDGKLTIEDPDDDNVLRLNIPYYLGGVSQGFTLGVGSLLIQVGDDPEDQIHIADFDPEDVFANPVLEQIEFADGTVLSYEQLIAHGFDLNGAEGYDTLYGTNANDRLQAFDGNDTIVGRAGNDTLDGGMGDDMLFGGAGNDTYLIDQAGDQAIELAGEGTDTIQTTLDGYTLGEHLENLELLDLELQGAAITGHGNALDNRLTGNALDNTLQGHDGNDVLVGAAGHDTLEGDAGQDSLYGGSGDDIYYVDDLQDQVFEVVNEGHDTVISSVSTTLANQVEDLALVGTENLTGSGNALGNTLRGNDGDNILFGRDGNDTLMGGLGNDTLDGGAGTNQLWGGLGDDTYRMTGDKDQITELGNEGNDTVEVTSNYTLGANVENLRITGFGLINGTGNSLNNTLYGNDQNNLLDGQGGDDLLIGARGNDTYIVDSTNDRVVELASEGYDEVKASASYTLADQIENLTLMGSAKLDGTGNTLANRLQGNSGDNTLSGEAGNDTMVGAAGDDLLIGGVGYDSLYGDEGNDTLTGGEDADLLDGGVGIDRMIGGQGYDTYNVDNEADSIVELAGEGNDLVRSTASYTLSAHIERLDLKGTAAINGIGNDLDNELTGNSGDNILSGAGGNDRLDGQFGNDTLVGGTGNDTYIVNNAGDSVLEQASEGFDIVISRVDFTLSNHVEALELTGGRAMVGIGNTEDNWLLGNEEGNELHGLDGNDDLDGAAGDDWLYGGDGEDVLYGGDDNGYFGDPGDGFVPTISSASSDAPSPLLEGGRFIQSMIVIEPTGSTNNDYLDGGAGNDSLDGGSGDDILLGGGGDDMLYGGVGNDELDGGEGVDQMAGGDGNDIYYVDGYSETVFVPGDGGDQGGGDPDPHGCTEVLIAPVPEPNLTDAHGNEGLGNGEDAPPPGHDQNYNDGTGTLPGSPGRQGRKDGHPGLGDQLIRASHRLASDVLAASVFVTARDADTLIPAGDDLSAEISSGTYVTTWTTDSISEAAEAGYDEVYSTATFGLSDHLEQLTLLGTENIAGFGNAQNNLLVGNAGNNLLDGGAGQDVLQGGAGDDIYVVDEVLDALLETGAEHGNDTVRASVDWALAEHFENLELQGAATLGYGNSLSNQLFGNAQDNTLYGLTGDDLLAGGRGNDTLIGGDGNDTYLIFRDEGIDILQDTSGQTTVQFGADITVEQVVIRTAEVEGVSVAQVRLLDSHGTELNHGFDIELVDGTLPEFDFAFADGSIHPISEFLIDTVALQLDATAEVVQTGNDDELIYAGAGSDQIYAGAGNDQLFGEDGNDLLRGEGGNDRLDGGAGSDQVLGGWGDDVLTGGAGNDVLYGAHGADTYQINRGDGHDIVSEVGCGDPAIDQIRFGADISVSELWFAADGDHLTISLLGSTDKVTVYNWYAQDQTVEQFATAEGDILDASQVQQLVNAMASFTPSAAGAINLSADEQQQIDTLIAASWQTSSTLLDSMY